MTLNQKSSFFESEGDEFFKRTLQTRKLGGISFSLKNFYVEIFSFLPLDFNPKNILEVGCCDGEKLSMLQKHYNCNCFGIDPSASAIKYGKETYPSLNLKVGSADNLEYEDNFFDILIFGSCLCLCDRDLLFKIAYEADRVLKGGGYLVIKDFYPSNKTYKNNYKHLSGLYTYKNDYSKMFTWNDKYSIVTVIPYSRDGKNFNTDIDERMSAQVLYKAHKTIVDLGDRTK